MDVLEKNREIRIAAGCSMACSFCTMGEGRDGLDAADVIDGRAELPESEQFILLAGDLLDARFAPLVRRLRDHGATGVSMYAHCGVRDPGTLRVLADAGLTGLQMMLPSAEKLELAAMTGERGSLRKAALLLSGARELGLDVTLTVPVVERNAGHVDETVRRAFRLAPIRRVVLEFVSECGQDRRQLRWDPMAARDAVLRTIDFCRKNLIDFRFGRNDAPPPCIFPLSEIGPETWGDLAGNPMEAPAAPVVHPFKACPECRAAAVCRFTGRHLAPASEPGPLVAGATDRRQRTWLDAAAIWIRRNDLRVLREKLALSHPACLNPWTNLETHSVRGVAISCATHRFQYGTVDRCVSWHDVPLTAAWNSDVMQSIRHHMKAGTPQTLCRPDCVVFHGGGPGDSWLTADPLTDVFHANLLKNLQEIIDGAEVLESMPQNLVIAPSLKCNIACVMCRFPGEVRDAPRPELTYMSERQFDEVIEMMPYLRVLNITGGEPLIADGTRRLLREFRTDRFLDGGIALTTNGILLEPSLIADMKKSRLLSIIISVNAASRATYEHVTGVDAFDRVMKNVAALMETRRELAPQPRVVLSFVIMKCNYREMADHVRTAARLGTDIQLLPMVGALGGESMFMNETDLKSLDEYVARELEPLVSGMRQAYRREVATLRSTIRRRLVEGDYSVF